MVQRSVVINVVGLCSRLIERATMPQIATFLERNKRAFIEPVLPAVTCTAQATYLTGAVPREHGIVGNGWYDREYSEHRFWKQSNHLVRGQKLWEQLRQIDSDFTCAKVFWWYNMYSTADFSITPRPLYPVDGGKVFDVHTHPMGDRERIKKSLGDFPFPQFWGPGAGIESTRWIAKAAKWFEEKYWPSLSLVYLPHLDYDLQRFGPNNPRIGQALHDIDKVVGDLIRFFEKRSIKVVLLSEYGITEVDRPVHLNRIFREKGWIQIKDEMGREAIDLGGSRAFAIADHQVAHIYLNDLSIYNEVQAVLEGTEGVGEVLEDVWKNFHALDHDRAGDLIAVADDRSWFTYYFWTDDGVAPDYARCVDIHRKCGYDPVELFVDPKIRHPKAAIGRRLLQKSLGFRTVMNVVPLDADLVRGSHGRIPESQEDWPMLVGDFSDIPSSGVLAATDVYGQLLSHCSAGHGYAGPALL
ncbi:MAG: nucleotide pyrophosphatase/phosphodiesterase family protein [Verrucomicrobiota bacterium]